MTSPPAQSTVARIEQLLALRRFEDARREAGWYAATNVDDANAHVLLARAAFGCGEYDEALRAAEQACTLDVTGATPHRWRCEILLALKRLGPAVEAGRRAVALAPDDPSAHFMLERAALADNNYHLAKDAAERVTALLPASPIAHHARGLVLLSDKRWSDAEREYRSAVALAPADATMINNLGHALLNQGHTGEATECFERAGALDPTNSLYLRNTAIAARKHIWGWRTRLGNDARGLPRSPGLVLVTWLAIRMMVSSHGTLRLVGIVLVAGVVAMLLRTFVRHRRLSQTAKRALHMTRPATTTPGRPLWKTVFVTFTIGFAVMVVVIVALAALTS